MKCFSRFLAVMLQSTQKFSCKKLFNHLQMLCSQLAKAILISINQSHLHKYNKSLVIHMLALAGSRISPSRRSISCLLIWIFFLWTTLPKKIINKILNSLIWILIRTSNNSQCTSIKTSTRSNIRSNHNNKT